MDSCSFSDVVFTEYDHSSLTYSNSTFTRCTFDKNTFIETVFDGVQFTECKFIEPDFTNAVMNAKFIDCMLINVIFKNANTRGMIFERSTFSRKPVTPIPPIEPIIEPAPVKVKRQRVVHEGDTTDSELDYETPKKKQARKRNYVCDTCKVNFRNEKYLERHASLYKNLEFDCAIYTERCPYCEHHIMVHPGHHAHLKHAMVCEFAPNKERITIRNNINESTPKLM